MEQLLRYTVHRTTTGIPLQTSLRDSGRDSLGKEFRLLLNRHSKPVPVEMILALIETEQGKKSVHKINVSWKVY